MEKETKIKGIHPSNETSSSRSTESVVMHQLRRTSTQNPSVPFNGVECLWGSSEDASSSKPKDVEKNFDEV